MTNSTHNVSAYLVGTPDTELNLTDGSLSLDSSRFPHVKASLTLDIPNGHLETVPATYTAWVESRRNMVQVPSPTALTGSGWAMAYGSNVAVDGWLSATVTATTTAYVFSDGAEEDIAAGDLVTLAIGYQVTALGSADAATHIRAVPHIRTGNVYVPIGLSALQAQNLLRPIVVGKLERVVVQWVADRSIPAGQLDLALTTASAQGNFGAVTNGFAWRSGELVIERGQTSGEFFSGATFAPDALTRYRWLGAVNGSPSVKETRSVVVPSYAVWVEDDTADLLDALDPRQDARVRGVIEATTSAGTQHREFNLGIRRRSVSQSSGEVTLDLASDEAMLDDYRPLVDDLTPLLHQSSLRAIVNYVLGEAIPGASLETSPAHDGDVTTAADAENIFKDPRALATYVGGGVSIGQDAAWPGQIEGVQHNSIRLYGAGANTDSYAYLLSPGSMNGMQVGEAWVLSATGRAQVTGTEHAQSRRLVFFLDINGTYQSFASAQLPNNNTPTRVSVELTVPTGTREVFVRAYHGATGGEVRWSQVRLTKKSSHPGADDTAYFWGSKPDTAYYDYSWVGGPDNSASKRRAVLDRHPELLIWKAGKSAIDFLHPIVQVHGLRLVCDEQRRWTLRDENYTAPGALNIRSGVNLTDGDDTIDRDSGMWFDAAIVYYRWTDYDGIRQEKVDAFALPGASRGIEIVKESPYPGPGFAEYVVRRAQHRGREVDAATVADWDAHAEQRITITLDGAPTQIGVTTSVAFDLGAASMSVRTQTTDTPAGAIDLLTGSIDALTGTIDAL